MNDALGVGGVQRVGNVDGDAEENVRFQRASRDAIPQILPVQKLHDDEGLTVLLPDLMDGADIGMVQRGRCLSLTLEAGQGLRVFGDVIGQKFQRDEAMQG